MASGKNPRITITTVHQDKFTASYRRMQVQVRGVLTQTNAAVLAGDRTITMSSEKLAEMRAKLAQSTIRANSTIRASDQQTTQHTTQSTTQQNNQTTRRLTMLDRLKLKVKETETYQGMASRAESRRQVASVAGWDRVTRSADRAASAYRRNAAAAAKAAAENAKATRASAGGMVAPVAAAAGVGGVGAAVKVGADFEQSMAIVRAVSDKTMTKTSKDFIRLENLAKKMGRTTQFSAKEAADALVMLSRAGVDANQATAMLPSTLNLASAAGIDLASAADMQISTMHQFGLQSKNTATQVQYSTRIADVMAKTLNKSAVDAEDFSEAMKYAGPVAHAYGQTLEDTASAIGILGNAGIRGSMAGTTLTRMMGRLLAPSDKVKSAMADIGLKAEELQGPHGLKPYSKIMEILAEKTKHMGEAHKKATLSVILGRVGIAGILRLMDAGPKAFADWAKSMDHVGGSSKRAGDIMLDTAQGGWKRMKAAMQDVAIETTSSLMPALKSLSTTGAGYLTHVGKKAGTFMSALVTGKTDAKYKTVVERQPNPGGKGTHIVARTVTQTKAASKDSEKGVEVRGVLDKMKGAVTGAWDKVWPALSKGADQLWKALAPIKPFWDNVLEPFIVGVGKGILSTVVGAFKILVPVIKLVAMGLGQLGKWAKPIRPVFEWIGEAVGMFATGPMLKAVAWIGKLGGTVAEATPLLGRLAPVFRLLGDVVKFALKPIQWYFKAWEFLGRGVVKVAGKLAPIIGSGLSKVGGWLSKAGKWVGDFAGLLGRGFKLWMKGQAEATKAIAGELGKVGSVLRRIGSAAKTGFKGLVSAAKWGGNAIYDVGRVVTWLPRQILGALLHIPGLFKKAFEKAGNLALEAITGMKGKLGDLAAKAADGFVNAFKDIGSRIGDLVAGGGQFAKKIANSVIDLLNSGLNRIATIKVMGHDINPMHKNPIPRFAAGGMVPGDPRQDGTLILAAGGEAILTGDGQRLVNTIGAMAGLPNAMGAILDGQLPHFNKGGMVSPGGIKKLARGAGFHGKDANVATAVALAESSGRLNATNYNTNGTVDRGLWQINSIHKEYDPARLFQGPYNAHAARGVYDQAKHSWKPWSTYNNGAYRKYMGVSNNAKAGGDTSSTSNDSATLHWKTIALNALNKADAWASRFVLRRPLIDSPFNTGMEAGRAGARSLRRAGSTVADIISAARVPITSHDKTVGGDGTPAGKRRKGTGSETGGTGWRGLGGKMKSEMDRMSRLRLMYAYGKGHENPSPRNGPWDCSSAVSRVVQASGVHEKGGTPFATTNNQGFLTFGQPGKGEKATIWANNGSGTGGHVYMTYGNRHWAAQSRSYTGWQKNKPPTAGYHPRHIPGMGSGGMVLGGTTVGSLPMQSPRLRRSNPGKASGLLAKLRNLPGMANKQADLLTKQLADALSDVTATTYSALVKGVQSIRREITRMLKGGVTREERARIQRLRAALTLTQAEMGRRTGLLLRQVDQQNEAMATKTAGLGHVMRRGGIDETSSRGIGMTIGDLGSQHRSLTLQKATLNTALARAKKSGDADAIAAISDQIKATNDALTEATTQMIEKQRELLTTTAQEAVDKSTAKVQHMADTFSRGLRKSGLDESTTAGMSAKLDELNKEAGVAGKANDTVLRQLAEARKRGDGAAITALTKMAQDSADTLDEYATQIAETTRAKALQSVQDVVDSSEGKQRMNDLTMSRLDLQQQLAGTAGSAQGNQSKADFIRGVIIPQMDQTLAALTAQQQTAKEQGNNTLADQIAEAIAQKQNDILSAQLDAQNAIKENTDPDKQYGGSVAFEAGGQRMTDLLTFGTGV